MDRMNAENRVKLVLKFLNYETAEIVIRGRMTHMLQRSFHPEQCV